MQKPITPARLGALVRDARTAAGLSQSELGARIGASRFWVAQFEKGKPSAELGLALKALHATGLAVRVESQAAAVVAKGATGTTRTASRSPLPDVDLDQLLAATTATPMGRSTSKWPSIVTERRTARER